MVRRTFVFLSVVSSDSHLLLLALLVSSAFFSRSFSYTSSGGGLAAGAGVPAPAAVAGLLRSVGATGGLTAPVFRSLFRGRVFRGLVFFALYLALCSFFFRWLAGLVLWLSFCFFNFLGGIVHRTAC